MHQITFSAVYWPKFWPLNRSGPSLEDFPAKTKTISRERLRNFEGKEASF